MILSTLLKLLKNFSVRNILGAINVLSEVLLSISLTILIPMVLNFCISDLLNSMICSQPDIMAMM